MVVDSVADALKSAGKWATPPLEEWTAVEAAIEKEKARLAAEAGRQREAAQQAEAAAERADADGGDAQGGAAAEHGLDSNGAYYPEQIRGHDRARSTEPREAADQVARLELPAPGPHVVEPGAAD